MITMIDSDDYPYHVKVGIKAKQWEDANWVMKRDIQAGEMAAWIVEHGMTDRFRKQFMKCLMDDGSHGFLFSFMDTKDATMFKLRWA